MFALLLAASCALALVLWAEFHRSSVRRPVHKLEPPPPVEPLWELRAASPEVVRATPQANEVLIAKISDMLEMEAGPNGTKPSPAGDGVGLAADLPRITGFRLGDVIEVAIEGPMPRPQDVYFEQVGRDAQILIEGIPALIIEATQAAFLHPSAIRFRSD